MNDFNNILIVGMGISGQSLKNLCEDQKWNFQCYDDKNPTEINWNNVKFIYFSPGIIIKNHHFSKIVHEKQIEIVNDMDLFYQCNNKAIYIGVTGTAGKTTTVKLIHHFFNVANIQSNLAGNIGIPIFDKYKLPYQIFEVSSFQLETMKTIRFDRAVITNISEDHLNRHETMENYQNLKLKIFAKDLNKNQKFYFEKTNFIEKENLLELIEIPENFNNSRLNSEHNRKNVQIAASIVKSLNIEPNFESLKDFQLPSYRQEEIYNNGETIIINDSKATNIAAVLSAIKSLKEKYNDFSIVWIAGGILKINDLTNLIKASNEIKWGFFFGKDKEIFLNTFENQIKNIEIFDSIEGSLKRAIDLNEKKVILFSPLGASFDQFSGYMERGDFFNKTVFNLLKIEK
jgi:UDP-N-acetylmuramoylalanine--D-glutamate ligase